MTDSWQFKQQTFLLHGSWRLEGWACPNNEVMVKNHFLACSRAPLHCVFGKEGRPLRFPLLKAPVHSRGFQLHDLIPSSWTVGFQGLCSARTQTQASTWEGSKARGTGAGDEMGSICCLEATVEVCKSQSGTLVPSFFSFFL